MKNRFVLPQIPRDTLGTTIFPLAVASYPQIAQQIIQAHPRPDLWEDWLQEEQKCRLQCSAEIFPIYWRNKESDNSKRRKTKTLV